MYVVKGNENTPVKKTRTPLPDSPTPKIPSRAATKRHHGEDTEIRPTTQDRDKSSRQNHPRVLGDVGSQTKAQHINNFTPININHSDKPTAAAQHINNFTPININHSDKPTAAAPAKYHYIVNWNKDDAPPPSPPKPRDPELEEKLGIRPKQGNGFNTMGEESKEASCRACRETFPGQSELSAHQGVTGACLCLCRVDPTFCPLIHEVQEQSDSHVSTENPENPAEGATSAEVSGKEVSCPECSQTFLGKSELPPHRGEKRQCLPFKCFCRVDDSRLCPLAYETKKQLDGHISMLHPAEHAATVELNRRLAQFVEAQRRRQAEFIARQAMLVLDSQASAFTEVYSDEHADEGMLIDRTK